MKATQLIRRDRSAAVLTLFTALLLVVCVTTTGSFAGARGTTKQVAAAAVVKAPAKVAAGAELLYTTKLPVNGDARAADEPPSRHAIVTAQVTKDSAGAVRASRTRT